MHPFPKYSIFVQAFLSPLRSYLAPLLYFYFASTFPALIGLFLLVEGGFT